MSGKVTISAIKADVGGYVGHCDVHAVAARLADRWAPIEDGGPPVMPEHEPAGASAGRS